MKPNKLFIKNFLLLLEGLGLNPKAFIIFIRGVPLYFKSLRKLKKQLKQRQDFALKLYPILGEYNHSSGIMKGHYFHQDLLIARKIFINNPCKHIDIGSRIDGFIAHVAAFREIYVFDIRHQKSNVLNIRTHQMDVMTLPKELINSLESISSLHAIEHFGLGRYGDPIDVDGHIKAIQNIFMMLKPNGKFYFSVPIGKQRIEFNAHRVFSLKYLLNLFENKFFINHFHYVNDQGDLFEDIELTDKLIEQNCNCYYGCGIFELNRI